MQNQKKMIYADLLRIFSIIGVITLHVSSSLNQVLVPPYSWWHVGNIINSSVRWAVPTFFMLSGMLLLNRDEPIKSFLSKRFFSVIPSFLFWSLIYYFWEIRAQRLIGNTVTPSIWTFITNFINGNIYYHLWFMYAILGLYLVIPILRLFIKNATNKHILYFIMLWLIANPVYVFCKLYLNLQLNIPLNFFTGYIGFLILGYYINKIEITKLYRLTIYILSIISLFIIICGTYFLTINNNGHLSPYFFDPLNLTNIIISVSIFIFFKYTNWNFISNNAKASKTTSWLAGITFQVYFLHPMILDLLSENSIDNKLIHPIIGIPVTTILITLISFGLITILKMLKLYLINIFTKTVK